MALSACDDKSRVPTPAQIERILGKSAGLWTELIDGVAEKAGGVTTAWNFPGAKYGWSLRLKKKERVILYMTPQRGTFLVGVVLGEKAVKAAQEEHVSSSALRLIDEAPRYAEGRGIRLPVASRRALRVALELAALKTGW